MSWWQSVLPWVPAIGIAFGLGYFIHSRRESVRTRQRELRQRFREQLRGFIAASEAHSGEGRWAVVPDNWNNGEELRRLREDGLISPREEHLKLLESLLDDVSGRNYISGRNIVPDAALNKELQAENKRRMNHAYQRLGVRSREYLAALARMDNGGYLTFVKYRRLVPNWRADQYVPKGTEE